MKNKVTKSILMGLATTFTLSAVAQVDISRTNLAASARRSPAGTAEGVSNGGGGDAVVQNGELVMRDFFDQKTYGELVPNTVEFAKANQKFLALMIDIAKADLRLAQAIYDDLLVMHIIFVDQDLPVLDPNSTALSGPIAQKQIAVRTGNDVVISRPSYELVPSEYLLLHESLHGVLKGSGPVHHSRVRAIVKFIKDNRADLKKADLFGFIDGLNAVDLAGYLEGSIIMETALIKRDTAAACAYMGIDPDPISIQGLNHFLGLYQKCESKELSEHVNQYLETRVVNVSDDIVKQTESLLGEVTKFEAIVEDVPYSKPRLLIDPRYEHRNYKNSCKALNSANIPERLRQITEEVNKIKIPLNELLTRQLAILKGMGEDEKRMLTEIFHSLPEEKQKRSAHSADYAISEINATKNQLEEKFAEVSLICK